MTACNRLVYIIIDCMSRCEHSVASVSFAETGYLPNCVLGTSLSPNPTPFPSASTPFCPLPSPSGVWVLVVSVATDLATRSRRDSLVYVAAVQDHYHCEQPIGMLSYIVFCWAGQHRTSRDVQVWFVAADRVRLRVGDRSLVKYATDPRHWHERRVLSTPNEEDQLGWSRC